MYKKTPSPLIEKSSQISGVLRGAASQARPEAEGTFARGSAAYRVLHRHSSRAWLRPSHGEQGHAKVQPWGGAPAGADLGWQVQAGGWALRHCHGAAAGGPVNGTV